jgi:putative peptidoglycan lipid II flippase
VTTSEAAPETSDGGLPEDGGTAPSTGRRLLKDNAVVAAGTLLSRITGVARLLAVYGLGRSLADDYLLANNTPNIIYELILGGVLTATLVPLFTEHVERDDREATSAVVTVTLLALVALTLVAFALAPLLMLLYGQNVDPDVDPDQFRRVGVLLSVLFVPQVFFYGAMALGSALLNARNRFFAAAWAPVLNNVVVVTILTLAVTTTDGDLDLDRVDGDNGLLLLLGLGTTSGIVAMAVSLVPALRRANVHIQFRPAFRHPAVSKAVRLSGWTVGYVVANQIAAQTVLVLAVNDVGTVRSYQVAFIFFQLPHGLLAVSLMTTFQPGLARCYVRDAWPEFHARLLQGLRLLVAVVVPASVGYLTLSVLFARRAGESGLGGENATDVAVALAGFAPGLIGFSIYLFTLRAFYAVQDTQRPFWINAAENVANIAFALVLIVPFSLLVGLTVAYSLAYWGAAALAIAVLLRRLPPGFDLRGFLGTLARCVVAAGMMAVAVAGVVLLVTAADEDRIDVAILAAVPVGALVYLAAARGLGILRDAGLAGRAPGLPPRLRP